MGDFREHMVGQVSGRLDHAPRVTGGTESTELTGERHKEIIPARLAPGSCDAIGRQSAFDVLAKRPFYVTWNRLDLRIPLSCQGEVGLQVFADQAVQQRSFLSPRSIERWCSRTGYGCKRCRHEFLAMISLVMGGIVFTNSVGL
jgi:hypothetical protein